MVQYLHCLRPEASDSIIDISWNDDLAHARRLHALYMTCHLPKAIVTLLCALWWALRALLPPMFFARNLGEIEGLWSKVVHTVDRLGLTIHRHCHQSPCQASLP